MKEAYEAVVGNYRGGTKDERTTSSLAKLWKLTAPLKCQAMAWRLLRDQLPTRENLRKRRIINVEDMGCCCCNAAVETSKHLFLECPEVSNLWYRIIGWIGARWVQPREIVDQLSNFMSLLGNGKTKRWLGGLWIGVVWVVWRWRNKVIHEQQQWDFRKMEEEIKCRFWSWCVVKGVAQLNTRFVDWTTKCLNESWNVN